MLWENETSALAEVERTSSPADMARALSEARDTLRHFETSALTDVAQTLSEITESLAQTTAEIAATRREEWVDAEGARLHLKRTKKQFERIGPQLPRHYVSERGILYNVREIDEWLMNR